MKKITSILLVLLSAPILLHVYQPAWKLEGFGIALGFWGMYISPILIFGTLIFLVIKSWK